MECGTVQRGCVCEVWCVNYLRRYRRCRRYCGRCHCRRRYRRYQHYCRGHRRYRHYRCRHYRCCRHHRCRH